MCYLFQYWLNLLIDKDVTNIKLLVILKFFLCSLDQWKFWFGFISVKPIERDIKAWKIWFGFTDLVNKYFKFNLMLFGFVSTFVETC